MNERAWAPLRAAAGVVFVLLLALPSIGQSVTVGRLTDTYYGNLPGSTGFTLIDLSNPAMSSGNVSTATVRWAAGSATCTSAFKVKILRPALSAFPTYTLVAERGPFDSQEGYVTVPLTPPIAVKVGDVIAVAMVRDSSCGGMGTARSAASMASVSGDFSGGTVNGTVYTGAQLLARASTDSNVVEGVIAAAGAVAGSNGSFFRTSVQLTNADDSPIAGKLVFHPAGASASAGDPSTTFSLPAYGTVSFPDLVAAMGVSGLGSLDVVSTSGGPGPLVTARVFDDQGANGTKGFTEDVVTPAGALISSESVSLAIPSDLANFRVNVGVRSLSIGAQLFGRIYDAAGNHVANTPSKTYPADYFEQVSLATFLGSTPPPAGGSVLIYNTSGNSIVYFSTTDNRTNDSSIKFATRP